MDDQLRFRYDILASVFFISVSILLFEMAQIRTFSYSLPPSLAYIGISLAMTGFGIGSMLLSLMPSLGAARLRLTLSLLAVLLAAAMVLSSALFARVSWDCIVNIEKGYCH